MLSLDMNKIREYLSRKKHQRPNLASLSEEQLYELTGITRDGKITMTALLVFGLYPQAYHPQLCIIATCVPAEEIGPTDTNGNRFTDTKRIEGTLPDMFDGALAFVRTNMQVATRVDPQTGKRGDLPQYPMDAVREAVLNALAHRDYSIHTEGMPIQLVMYANRIEITNPGGLYGRLTIDQLGNVQPDTRNPVLVTCMETLGQTENRYSGIPTIRHAIRSRGLPDPAFSDRRGSFSIILYNETAAAEALSEDQTAESTLFPVDEKGLLTYAAAAQRNDRVSGDRLQTICTAALSGAFGAEQRHSMNETG